MAEEIWGPWIDYVKGCKAGKAGQYVQHLWGRDFNKDKAELDGWRVVNRYTTERILPWDYIPKVGPNLAPLIRYRIRKPKGLTILEGILREVEDDGGVGYKEREKEDAST